MVEASLVNFAELVVLTVGVVIALQQLRDIKQTRETELETRQAQLFMQVWQQYNSVEYAMQRYEVYDMQWEDYDDFQRKYLDVPAKEMRPYASYVSIARLFEGLWLLIQEKLIDEKLVYQMFMGDIVRYWEKFLPRLEDLNARGIVHGYEPVGSLYQEAKEYRDKRYPGMDRVRRKRN